MVRETCAIAIALTASMGCQDPEPATTTDPTAAAPLQKLYAGPKRDTPMPTKAAFAFRNESGTFRAGYTTHDVEVRDGAIELVPHHYDALKDAWITGGKLVLETGEIRRGEDVLGGAGTASIDATGSVQIVRGEVVETITNRNDGIEQAWHFDSIPQGAGDLTVEISAAGQDVVATNDSGVHFKSRAGLGFVYSHAVWTDAADHEWEVSAKVVDGQLVLAVPADLLAETVFPATLDPTVTAETAVDNPVIGSTGTQTALPVVAFDGTNYLVVWQDNRLSADEDIFATRVSATGTILDTSGIKIAATPGKQTNPAVVYAGGKYIVAWEDFKVSGGTDADIVAASVTTAGVVTQLGTVAGTTTVETEPQLAAIGTGALLAWNSGGTAIKASVLATTFGAAFTVASGTTADPVVAANPGGNYLVAWSDGATATADIHAQLVTPAGALSGAAIVVSNGAGKQSAPAAAFDGTNYALAWTNNSAGINVFGGRVSPAGAALDGAAGFSISTATNNQQFPAIACPPTGCLVTWEDNRNNATTAFDIYGQLMTTTFGLSGANFAISTAGKNQNKPSIATSGSGFFVTWEDFRDDTVNTVFGSRVTTAGSVTDASGIMLVEGDNLETAVAAGHSGSTDAVVWSDTRNFGADIELVRWNGSTKLDANARPVSTATFSQSAPAITQSSAGNFVVAWSDTRNGVDKDIYAERVDSTGASLDAAGIAITTATNDQLLPAVATDGNVTLIAWQDRRNSATTKFDIYGALVNNSTGAVTVSDIVISNQPNDQSAPSVTFDTTNNVFVVAWSDQRTVGNVDVYATRVSTAGAVMDGTGVLVSGAAGSQLGPQLAFISGTLLAVWEDRRTDGQGDIYGARLSASGGALTTLDPNGIVISALAGTTQTAPVVAALSGSFLVAWSDNRNAATTGFDIYGNQVSVTGAIATDFVISNDPTDETHPSLADGTTAGVSNSSIRMGYDLFVPADSTTRVESRRVSTSSGNGQTCGGNGACSTGFCVDGKCCDTACGGNVSTDCLACAHTKTGAPDGVCSPIVAGTICRGYADTTCDQQEKCDGINPDCPPDIGRNAGKVCNTVTHAVCGPVDAGHAPHICP